jgi:hypothetical protein
VQCSSPRELKNEPGKYILVNGTPVNLKICNKIEKIF